MHLLFSAVNFLSVALLCKSKNFGFEMVMSLQRKIYIFKIAIMLQNEK